MSGLELAPRIAVTLTALMLLVGCVSRQQYDALEARYQKLASEVSNQQMQMAQLQNAIKVTLNDELLFRPGSWDMTTTAQQTIGTLVPILTSIQHSKIMIIGYTDNTPIGPGLIRNGVTSNLMLSQKRADAIRQLMTSQGVDPSLVSAHGLGEADPAAPNDTAAGRAQNRRVELLVVGKGGEMLPDTLPPTTVLASSPNGSAQSSNRRGPSNAVELHPLMAIRRLPETANYQSFRARHES
jgi:chemotaxis protein MotB